MRAEDDVPKSFCYSRSGSNSSGNSGSSGSSSSYSHCPQLPSSPNANFCASNKIANLPQSALNGTMSQRSEWQLSSVFGGNRLRETHTHTHIDCGRQLSVCVLFGLSVGHGTLFRSCGCFKNHSLRTPGTHTHTHTHSQTNGLVSVCLCLCTFAYVCSVYSICRCLLV